ncbi:nucleosidase [Nocardioides sp. Bht2]|uniref:nucleosidase n=1 Tax=Nocardioides sp. Bht2 TaxID=3392297 RepID=UPI0039B384F7
MSYLVVSATKAEAAYVPADVPVVITGVGKTAAAVAVTRALAELPNRDDLVVVNIGSAGALRDGMAGVYEPAAVWNHDLSADAIRALGFDPQDVLELSDEEGVLLATGDMFVSDPAVRDALAQRAHMVDMEGFAVVWAARSFGVPVRLIKHISDNADEGAMEWVTLVDRSARALAERLAEIMSAAERT